MKRKRNLKNNKTKKNRTKYYKPIQTIKPVKLIIKITINLTILLIITNQIQLVKIITF